MIYINKSTLYAGRGPSVVGPVAMARGAVVKGRSAHPTNGPVD